MSDVPGQGDLTIQQKKQMTLPELSEEIDRYKEEEESLEQKQLLMQQQQQEGMLQENVQLSETQQKMMNPQSVFDLSFKSLWKQDTSEFLHQLAEKNDVKKEEKEKEIKDLNQMKTGRSEKTRRNHLTKSAKGFEKASLALKKIRDERAELEDGTKQLSEKKRSQKILSNTDNAETALKLMFESQRNAVLATGKNDLAEKQTISELHKKYIMSLLNLYREQSKKPGLLPAQKEELIKKMTRLKVGNDSTMNRFFFAGTTALKDYAKYTEMESADVLKMSSDNSYNTVNIKKVWAVYDDKPTGAGGYVCTPASALFNRYCRIKAARAEFEALKRAKKEADPQKVKEIDYEEKALKEELAFFHVTNYTAWTQRQDKLMGELDSATKENTLQKDQKFYRMVDASFVRWAFPLKEDDKVTKFDSQGLVDYINKRTGTVLEDKGVMSVGWRMDPVFKKRPIMLTLLTDKGKKCFVTKNHKESEVIFGRNTKYQLVAAINHEKDVKRMKLSPEVKDSTTNVKELERAQEDFNFDGVELVMKVLSEPDERMD